MIRKIIFIFLSLAIVVTGIFAFRKLNYWERSAWIFKYNSMDQRFEGRRGRGPAEFNNRSRETFDRRRNQEPERELRERPDGEFSQGPGREFRDTDEREFRPGSDREFRESHEDRASFGPGDRGRGGHGGDFRGGQNIRLRNVWWFLAVFSGFTVFAIILDRAWQRLRKRKLRTA